MPVLAGSNQHILAVGSRQYKLACPQYKLAVTGVNLQINLQCIGGVNWQCHGFQCIGDVVCNVTNMLNVLFRLWPFVRMPK